MGSASESVSAAARSAASLHATFLRTLLPLTCAGGLPNLRLHVVLAKPRTHRGYVAGSDERVSIREVPVEVMNVARKRKARKRASYRYVYVPPSDGVHGPSVYRQRRRARKSWKTAPTPSDRMLKRLSRRTQLGAHLSWDGYAWRFRKGSKRSAEKFARAVRRYRRRG